MNQQSSAIIWFESLCLRGQLSLYSCSPASWQVRGTHLWTQCGQCSVLGGRAGTSHPPRSCPSPPPRSLAWLSCSGAWTDKFSGRRRDTRQLCNETSIRRLGDIPTTGLAQQNSNKASRKLCRHWSDMIYYTQEEKCEILINLITCRQPPSSSGLSVSTSRTRGRCRSSHWRCSVAVCRGHRVSPVHPRCRIYGKYISSTWNQELIQIKMAEGDWQSGPHWKVQSLNLFEAVSRMERHK